MPDLPAFPLTALSPASLMQSLGRRAAAWRVPQFTAPPALGRALARLPQRPPALLLSMALNLALDRILPREALAPLNGRRLRICVGDLGLDLDFTLTSAGFRPIGPASKPDLVISAGARDYLALALREEDADTLFFSRRLRMEGDTELGLLVKNTLDAVDWDALRARLPPRIASALSRDR